VIPCRPGRPETRRRPKAVTNYHLKAPNLRPSLLGRATTGYYWRVAHVRKTWNLLAALALALFRALPLPIHEDRDLQLRRGESMSRHVDHGELVDVETEIGLKLVKDLPGPALPYSDEVLVHFGDTASDEADLLAAA
jgi:hypothetical protein